MLDLGGTELAGEGDLLGGLGCLDFGFVGKGVVAETVAEGFVSHFL